MRLHFVEQIRITSDIVSFVFRPAAPVSWIAGQSIRLELPARDYGSEERRFTISSAPYEGDVTVTTRLSESEFKRVLFALRPGDVVDGFGIEGDFVWGDVVRPVLVASGIGITPFYAMLKQRLHETGSLQADLLYGGMTDERAFAAELEQWQRQFPTFTVVMAGPLDEAAVVGWLGDIGQRLVYLSGSERLVQGLRQELVTLGIDAAQIKTDLFTGDVTY